MKIGNSDLSAKMTLNSDENRKKTPVFIIDDNHLFCEGLKHFLASSPFEVVGEFSNIREFDSTGCLVEDGSIFLLDLPGSFQDPRRELDDLRARFPAIRLVVLTSKEDKVSFVDCVSACVDGYLLKNISPSILIESLRLIILGEKVYPSVLAIWLLDSWTETNFSSNQLAAADADLSRREIETLECLVNGDSNKIIARKLSISDATVKVHVKNILRKISAANRTQAAIWALNMGVVGDGRFAVQEVPTDRDSTGSKGPVEGNEIGTVDDHVG